MNLRFAPRAGRCGVLIGAFAALLATATELAASPTSDKYAGRTSDGGRVALRVVAGGTRVHWAVSYRGTRNCNPSGFTSRGGSAFEHNFGARIDSNGRYSETVSSSVPTTFNGHSGYRDSVKARFSGRFITSLTASGRVEQRETFFRPNGSKLATCVRHLTYTAHALSATA